MADEKKPKRAAAMVMKCAECCGNWTDGRVDCGITGCSLYPWMPFKSKEPDLTWMDFNPKRVGKITWEESKRDISDEQRERMSKMAKERFGKKEKK